MFQRLILLATGLLATAAMTLADIHSDYASRRDALAPTGIFAPLDTLTLTPAEREAMEFIYAYSPLPDIADRPAEFFLDNVRAALRAREEMPWDVHDREWLHFVLPVRVNNEPLDSSRIPFYAELRPRLEGLTMAEAILEVNHWLHEKATYQPSDGRTRSPLQTVAAAIGRCGEESTFGVAALRAVGIPARQVYTPRWAHTDDNHAWIEAWADGRWHFLGACEPEPVLDLGWFNAPASRGMLMNTRVFGAYDGPEEVLTSGPGYTVINVTDIYAPTRKLTATVTDPSGAPVEGASVRFGLYNYAEFYPLASLTTDAAGEASLITGLGDILVWASDAEGNYAFKKASASDSTIILTPAPEAMLAPGEIIDLDVTVPTGSGHLPYVSPEARAENDRRFAAEDSIRAAYMRSAFIPDDPDRPEALRDIARNVRSNRAIFNLFPETPRPDSEIVRFLHALSVKDLGDAPVDLLASALRRPVDDIDYVMNPRISTEELTPWWEDLEGFVTPDDAAAFRADPDRLARFIAEEIAIVAEPWEPANVHMSPRAVWHTRQADGASRDIFFVAAARTLGVPARLDPVTSTPQWRDGRGTWHDVLRPAPEVEGPHGRLILEYTDPSGYLPDPQYYTHFTLSRLVNGIPELLTYEEGGASALNTFAAPGAPLAPGDYLLTSGRRMADGNVLAAMEMIRIDTTTVTAPLRIRSSATDIQVIGAFNSESPFLPLDASGPASILSRTGRGYFVIGIIDGSEPSTHALNDIAAVASELEADGRKIILLSTSEDGAKKAQPTVGALPSTVVKGIDPDGAIAAAIASEMHLPASGATPVFIIADTFNRIVFLSSGYTIGLGRTLLDTLSRLER